VAREFTTVGVIGLGTGTIAAYGREGDVYRFYDIDPRVVKLARQEFTYLADSPATIEIALGEFPTGKLVGAQIKSGMSYIRSETSSCRNSISGW
jgi:hypothetical protein